MSNPQSSQTAFTTRYRQFVLRPLALSGAIQGLILQQRFPVEDPAPYAMAVDVLLSTLKVPPSSLKRHVFVQIGETGRAGSQAIRELGPMLDDYGLGIHPEAEPPRTWNRHDFERITLNDQLPPLFLEVMRANTLRPQALEAVQARFFATGAFAEAYTVPAVDFYESATALFKPRITNRTARMFPYHAPILRRRALESASPQDVEQWMCGAQIYLREAVEEEGLVLLFRGESEPTIRHAANYNGELTGIRFLA